MWIESDRLNLTPLQWNRSTSPAIARTIRGFHFFSFTSLTICTRTAVSRDFTLAGRLAFAAIPQFGVFQEDAKETAHLRHFAFVVGFEHTHASPLFCPFQAEGNPSLAATTIKDAVSLAEAPPSVPGFCLGAASRSLAVAGCRLARNHAGDVVPASVQETQAQE